MNRFNQSGFPKARRRVNMRSALFLLMIAFGVLLLRGSIQMMLPGMGQGLSVALSMLASVAGFGVPAYMGLCLVDGDQRRIVPVHALSRSHILHLTLLGVLFVCPASLAADMLTAVFSRMGFGGAAGSAAPGMGLFLPMLLGSVLLAPVCEELFFRGYLTQALRPYSQRGALVLPALAFAVMHGVDAALLPRFALGCLLTMMMNRTGSVVAPMLVHAAYNFTLLVLVFSGLEGFVTGPGLIACVLRILGCAAFAGVLRRAYADRMQRKTADFGADAPLGRRELALLIGAGAALLATMIVSGVTA